MWHQQRKRWKGSKGVNGILVLQRCNRRHVRCGRHAVGRGRSAEWSGTILTLRDEGGHVLFIFW